MSALHPKFITLYMLLLVDILLLPSVLQSLVVFITQHKFVLNIHPIRGISETIHDPKLGLMWLVVQVLFIAVIAKLFMRIMPKAKQGVKGFGGPEAAGSGQHGTSRWITDAEMERSTLKWYMRQVVLAGGIVLGAEIKTTRILWKKKINAAKSFAWVDPKDSNSIIIGATRSGKSRRIILPTIWSLAFAGESMIVTDPKGELYLRTKIFLELMGYKVTYLDFRTPGRGNRTNYLQPVIDAYKRGDIGAASKHAWTIANMFVYSKPGADQGETIWKDGAEAVIAALILAVTDLAEHDDQKHMYSVLKVLSELGKPQKAKMGNQIVDYYPINDFFDSLPLEHPARDAYATAAISPERTRGGFFGNVASLLRLFADPAIKYLTSKQDHNLIDVGLEKTAVFLIIPDEDKTRHTYAALYLNQTYDALVDCANQHNGRLPVRVNCLVDEFGNMPPFPNFDNKMTVSLGRGIRWNIAVQDYAQLDRLYGKDVARIIRGNVQNTIYLLTNDFNTADELSKLTGTYTVQTDSSSYSVTRHSTTAGASNSLTSRPLLTAHEILTIPEDHSLVLRGRLMPAILNLPDLSLWPAYPELESSEYDREPKLGHVNYFLPAGYVNQTPSYLPDDEDIDISNFDEDGGEELPEKNYMDVD